MKYKIDNEIINLMQNDMRRDYTIPELMSALDITNRERVATAIARLEGKEIVEVSREKGRVKYYRLKIID
jgi:DNA-binding transcriptional ArsR family regulator